MITLEFLSGPFAGERRAIRSDTITLGRDPDGAVPLDDNEVSWAHCRLELRDEVLTLTDLESSNGTFVAESRISAPAHLGPGDSFTIGATVLRVWFAVSKTKAPAQVNTRWADEWSGFDAGSTLMLDAPLSPDQSPLPETLRSRPRLTFTSGPEKGRILYLGPGVTSIGRAGTNLVCLFDRLVGLKQAIINIGDDGQATLTSRDPNYAVAVNGDPITVPTHLRHGDLIQLGASVIEFGAAGIDPAADEPMKTMALPQGRFTVGGQVLIQAALTLGRDPACHVYLDGPQDHIAPEHADIRFVLGTFEVTARASCATYVNGERVVQAALADGDRITIGHYTIQIGLSGLSCDLTVGENSPGVAVESFASSHGSSDPYRTMYRVAVPEPEPGKDNYPEEGPAQRHRPAWVPPLDVVPDRRTWMVVAAGVLLALGLIAYFAWPSGTGFLNQPLSPVHNSQDFTDLVLKTTGGDPGCDSCHSGFAGVQSAKCSGCHPAKETTVHAKAEITCGGCHVEHPRGETPLKLVKDTKCASCHQERHSDLIKYATAPEGTKSTAPITAMRTQVQTADLHRIHAGIQGRCAGCHADTQRKHPVPPQASCLRCHGEQSELASQRCATCHGEHDRSPFETTLAAKTPSGPAPTSKSSLEGPLTPHSSVEGTMWALVVLVPIFALVMVRRQSRVDEGMEAYTPVHSTEVKKLIHILDEPCVGCGECVVACPYDVLDLVKLRESGKVVARVLNFDSCRECGTCAEVCKPLALTRRYPGEPLPMVSRPDLDAFYMTNIEGLYLIGEAAGKSLVRNANNLGARTIKHIIHTGTGPGTARAAGVDYEVAIVGSGPGGLSAGLTARRDGLTYIVLEKGATFAQTIQGYPKGKPVQNQPQSTEDIGALPVADTNREALLEMWNKTLEEEPVHIVYKSEVTQIEPLGADGQGFRITTKTKSYTALKVILATGTRGSPRTLRGVPGNDLEKLRYQLVDPDLHQGDDVIVVGGGNSALEAAIAIAKVTGASQPVRLVYRKDTFARASQKNVDELEALANAGHIVLHLNSNPIEVTPQDMTIEDASGQRVTVANSYVYCMLGAEPPTKWLTSIGVTYSDKPQGWTPGPSDDLSFVQS